MELTSQTIGTFLGWLGLGWVSVQGLLLAVRTLHWNLRARRRLADQRAEFCRRVEATARKARAEKAIPDWEGWRPFRVAAIVDETHDTKSFYFSPADNRPLARFAPGQYLTFRLPVANGEVPVVRCYSISERTREDYYRCTVKRIGPPADRPSTAPGRGSGHLHDAVKVGNVLDVRAPSGTFFVDPFDEAPVVLVGAGIGITPLFAMLDAIVHAARKREVYVLFGFRSGHDHPFKDRLTRLAASNSHVKLHTSYSAPRKEDTLYRDFNHVGRMTIDRVRAILPSNNFQFYVCGPSQMMEALVPALWEWGVPESHVHFEAFGPASIKRLSAQLAAARTIATSVVHFERSNRTLSWDGTFDSLLEFGQANGVKLLSGCRAGSCGECMVAVRSGKVTQRKRPGITVPAGHCLTCISVPDGELVLDA